MFSATGNALPKIHIKLAILIAFRYGARLSNLSREQIRLATSAYPFSATHGDVAPGRSRRQTTSSNTASSPRCRQLSEHITSEQQHPIAKSTGHARRSFASGKTARDSTLMACNLSWQWQPGQEAVPNKGGSTLGINLCTCFAVHASSATTGYSNSWTRGSAQDRRVLHHEQTG